MLGSGEGGTEGEDSASTLRAAGLQPLVRPSQPNDSWYREVLDLRKRAGEYKVCAYTSHSSLLIKQMKILKLKPLRNLTLLGCRIESALKSLHRVWSIK